MKHGCGAIMLSQTVGLYQLWNQIDFYFSINNLQDILLDLEAYEEINGEQF